MLKREVIHQQIFYYFLLIQAFTFPLWKRFTPIIISLIVLNWLLEFNFVFQFKKIFIDKKLRYFLFFISIYFLYIIGLFYTSNFAYAWFDLEVKLTFLLIPLIFFSTDLKKIEKKQVINILMFFVFGCFVSSVISMLHSFYLYQSIKTSFWFFYTYASAFHHPSYISMYLIFAISIIVYFLMNDLIKNIKHFSYFLLFWFSVYTIMLSSKAGIFSLILGVVFLFGYFIIKKRKYLISTIAIIILLFSLVIVIKKIPIVANRITASLQVLKSNKNDVNMLDGTVQRMEIWKTSLDIIKENFLIGVGTGDVKDELLKHYDEKGMTLAKTYKLNAHGQYFQTFITLGLLGFLSLILLFFIPAFQSFKNQNFIYFIFLLIVAFNILFESMFENQAGVVFYTFFNSFLFLSGRKLTNSN